jgi:hypothetical protein
MSSDALFQLGMGPVELDATQTEDHKSLRPERARGFPFRSHVASAAFAMRAAMPRLFIRLRGNSAKALIGTA